MPTESDIDLVRTAADHAIAYASSIDGRAAAPTTEAVAALAAFDEALPDGPTDAAETIELLHRIGGPATMGSTGPNYFGFVNGATYPVALGASFLVDTWDQNAALPVMSPVAAAIYDVARRWTLDVLGLDGDSDVAFVTGATVANASCLAAARDALLDEHGWDVQRDGLFGAPEIHVVIGEKAHSTLRKSLGLIGLGRERVTIVPADDQGRMRAGDLPLDIPDGAPVLVCAQAGEVNTGAFDPFHEIADWVAARQRLAPRRWCVRSVGARRPEPRRSRRGLGPSGLVGHRRSQVAQRHLRLRHRDRPPCGGASANVCGGRRISPAGRWFRSDAPHAPVVAARPPDRGVGGAANIGPLGRRRHGETGIRRGSRDRRSPRETPDS